MKTLKKFLVESVCGAAAILIVAAVLTPLMGCEETLEGAPATGKVEFVIGVKSPACSAPAKVYIVTSAEGKQAWVIYGCNSNISISSIQPSQPEQGL